mmetsp:Transcript_34911/g.75511  ORF Transcript_34911/g.75511 Transcript_34911/m.75511 type:complete len:557 (-) Transcript_34911:32-1702(-)
MSSGHYSPPVQTCGKVASWKRFADPDTGEFKSFGFCEYDSGDGVLRCLRLMKGFKVGDDELNLKVDNKTEAYIEDFVKRKKDALRAVRASQKSKTTLSSAPVPSAPVSAEEDDELNKELDEAAKVEDERVVKELERLSQSFERVDGVERAAKGGLDLGKSTAPTRAASTMMAPDAMQLKQFLAKSDGLSEEDKQRAKIVQRQMEKFQERQGRREQEEKARREGTTIVSRTGSEADGRQSQSRGRDSHSRDDDRRRDDRRRDDRRRDDRGRDDRGRDDRGRDDRRDRYREDGGEERWRRLEREYGGSDRDRDRRRDRSPRDRRGDRDRGDRDRGDRDRRRDERDDQLRRDAKRDKMDADRLLADLSGATGDAAPGVGGFKLGTGTKRPVVAAGTLFTDDDDKGIFEEKKKLKLTPIVYSAEELEIAEEAKKAMTAAQAEKEKADKKKALKLRRLIDSIPKATDELFAFEIDWEMFDEDGLAESKVRPFVNKKIVEYLGEEEPTLAAFIVAQTKKHCTPATVQAELVEVLDTEAEMFVVKLWRFLIFECMRARVEKSG